jgi:hypothetical protein
MTEPAEREVYCDAREPRDGEPDCDCACHDDFYGESDAVRDAHDDRSCRGYQDWLNATVHVQLSSLQNITYRHVIDTQLTRREWLELDDRERGDTVNEAVLRHVGATVLDDPFDP